MRSPLGTRADAHASATPPRAESACRIDRVAGRQPTFALGAPNDDTVVGVLGLGYVGLPLAVEFGKRFATRGFDVDACRIAELRARRDASGELGAAEIAAATRLEFCDRIDALHGCDVFVVTVPTPIDERKRPDLAAFEEASRLVGQLIRRGNVVIFESTVFPGATEEIAVPLVASASGLAFNRDFFAGYSPERINPGDQRHRLADVVKITAGSTPEAAAFVGALYRRIVAAGTHPVADIRTAEAAKVIENIQRDLNIALVNEFAMIFDRLGLDTEAVLQAAGSKWNFHAYRPGLVGGHCIGVDPYYLAAKAEEAGFHPELLLAGRGVNDAMPRYVANRLLELMANAGIEAAGARVLVLGLAFKENCADVRNTKVVEVVETLRQHGAQVDVFDPCVNPATVAEELLDKPPEGAYDGLLLAVAHDVFRDLGAARIRAFGKPHSVLFDVKHLLPADAVDGRL